MRLPSQPAWPRFLQTEAPPNITAPLALRSSQNLGRYPPTDSLVPKRNDRQKIELNLENLEGPLGCKKSTHSMNAAPPGLQGPQKEVAPPEGAIQAT